MNHSGSWPGYNTFIERHTDNDKTFILLSNMERGSLPYIAIRRILYHLQNNQPQPAIKLSADSLKQYKGKYTLAPDFVLTIWVENEKLLAQATGQTSFILTPEKTDWFIIPELVPKYSSSEMIQAWSDRWYCTKTGRKFREKNRINQR